MSTRLADEWRRIALLLLAAAFAACGPSEQQKRAAAEARAAQDLAAYRQLVAAQSWESAMTTGREIERKYPGTQAAAEVHAALADLETKASAAAGQQRLAALWTYQTGVESGAQQTSASIAGRVSPAESERVRLILRRHADWGQAVYLYGGGKGFECPPPCAIMIRYDDAAGEPSPAFLPATGEPAIFIKDDAAFLTRLPKVRRITIFAMLAGRGPATIEFEVGGYDPARFASLPSGRSAPRP